MDPGKLCAWRKGFLATLTDYCTFGSHLNREGDLVGHFLTVQERESKNIRKKKKKKNTPGIQYFKFDRKVPRLFPI